MLVYRVVDKDGEGPYSGDLFDYLGIDKSYTTKHSSPEDDGIEDGMHWFEYSGFENLEHLVNWFHEYLPEMSAEGCTVRIYEVEDENIRKGHSQLVFKKFEENFVEDFPLSALLTHELYI